MKSLEDFPDIIKQVESVVELRKKKMKEKLEKINKAAKKNDIPSKQKSLHKTTEYVNKVLTKTNTKDKEGAEKGKRRVTPLTAVYSNSIAPASSIHKNNKEEPQSENLTQEIVATQKTDLVEIRKENVKLKADMDRNLPYRLNKRNLISHAERRNLLSSIKKFSTNSESIENNTEILGHQIFKRPSKHISPTESKGHQKLQEEVALKKPLKIAKRVLRLIKKEILKYFGRKASKVAPTNLKKHSLLNHDNKEKK